MPVIRKSHSQLKPTNSHTITCHHSGWNQRDVSFSVRIPDLTNPFSVLHFYIAPHIVVAKTPQLASWLPRISWKPLHHKHYCTQRDITPVSLFVFMYLHPTTLASYVFLPTFFLNIRYLLWHNACHSLPMFYITLSSNLSFFQGLYFYLLMV